MSKKVMIVDDSVMMRMVIKNLVSSDPRLSIVAFASNGKEALEQLSEHPDLDLVLLDIEMPKMDGLEFLRHVRLRCKAKVIVLSSVVLNDSANALKAKELGADAIVTKSSGAVSFDLAEKRGSELFITIEKVLNLQN